MSASTEFLFFWDGMEESKIPSVARTLLERSGVIQKAESGNLFKSKVKKSLSFCGILRSQNDVYVFLPKGYPYPSDDEKQFTAKKIINCLSKYCGQTGVLDNEDLDPSMVGDLGMFPLYKEILDDYLRNGLFNAHEEVKSKKLTGKIDWKETINKVSPVMLQGQGAFYPHFITKNFRYNSSNIITKVHAGMVNEIDEQHGWWFSKNDSDRVAPELNGCSRESLRSEQVKALIHKELNSTFYERNIRLLKNIIKYIESSPDKSSNGQDVRGVKKFEVIWERMIDEALKPHASDIISKLPSPAYETELNEIVLLKAKGGRIDTLIRQGRNVAIVDAKYYNSKTVHTAPGWPDLVKQFFYEKLVSSLKEDLEISNIFVMPSISSNRKPIFGHIARIENNQLETLGNLFPKICCLYACQSSMIDHYIEGKKDLNLRVNVLALGRQANCEFR